MRATSDMFQTPEKNKRHGRAAYPALSQSLRRLSILALLAFATGCIAIDEQRGYRADAPITDSVKPGKTTREEVQAALGSPSSQSSFGEESWYYVSSDKERIAFLRPSITEQQVTRIVFDNEGVVQTVENYSLKDSADIPIASRVTPTEGHKLGIIEQVMGNLGRFNKETKKSPTKTRGPY